MQNVLLNPFNMDEKPLDLSCDGINSLSRQMDEASKATEKVTGYFGMTISRHGPGYTPTDLKSTKDFSTFVNICPKTTPDHMPNIIPESLLHSRPRETQMETEQTEELPQRLKDSNKRCMFEVTGFNRELIEKWERNNSNWRESSEPTANATSPFVPPSLIRQSPQHLPRTDRATVERGSVDNLNDERATVRKLSINDDDGNKGRRSSSMGDTVRLPPKKAYLQDLQGQKH
ncbi:unnamed protein product [Dimorphilus gyrociliatus]|uniref:Uncharacterized protein n=1 Tax=Dimorphilus gyrociliatus TaxID=2664684 RepID=A0A7I8VLM3_9ANNE|nr:unnamed protein product [Dimorphilus gyrociliatus]